MERALLWTATLANSLILLASLALALRPPASGHNEPPDSLPPNRFLLFLAPLLSLLVFLGSLPSRPPFAPGHALGTGFLVGGAVAVMSSVAVYSAYARRTGAGQRISSMAPFAGGVVAVGLPLLFRTNDLADFEMGTTIGWFCTALVIGLFLVQGRVGRQALLSIAAGMGWIATLSAGIVLGDYANGIRFGAAPTPTSWSVLFIALAAVVPFVLVVCALPDRWLVRLGTRLPLSGMVARVSGSEDGSAALTLARVLVGAILLYGFAALFGRRLETPGLIAPLIGLGLGAGVLIWWLSLSDNVSPRFGRNAGRSGAPLMPLIVVAASMAAFQRMGGVGMALLLVAFWLVTALALNPSSSPSGESMTDDATATVEVARSLTLLRPALLGTILLLYWLFSRRFHADLHGVSLTDHYALFGFLAGALVPNALSEWVSLSWHGRTVPGGRIVAAGAFVLMFPALIVLVFGAKCALALFFGLALAAGFGTQPTVEPGEGQGATAARSANHTGRFTGNLLVPLFALGVALALAQWTGHVLPFADSGREVRARIVEWVLAAGGLLVIANALSERWLNRGLAASNDAPNAKEAQ